MKESKIWKAVGRLLKWYLPDGTEASPAQADAIAMGFIKGFSKSTHEVLWSIGPCSRAQASRGYRQWAQSSSIYHGSAHVEINLLASEEAAVIGATESR